MAQSPCVPRQERVLEEVNFHDPPTTKATTAWAGPTCSFHLPSITASAAAAAAQYGQHELGPSCYRNYCNGAGDDVKVHDVFDHAQHRPHDKTPVDQVQDPQAPLPPCHSATTLVVRRQDNNSAPAGSARSQVTSRSSHPNMPSTVTKAMARAQMLLDFPPKPDKMDEWRATIWSLIKFADANISQFVEPCDAHQPCR